MKEKGSYINDLKDGWFLFYNEDGSLSEECSYLHGLKNGGARLYLNDYLFNEGTYQDGEKIGLWKTYNSNGKITLETNEN